MKIGEIAQQVGVSTSIIRYYEGKGLLPRVQRDSSGYRSYSEVDLDRIRLVTGARQLGICFADIREILAIRDVEEIPCKRVLELLGEKAIEAGKRIGRLRRIELELRQMHDQALTLPGADHA
jgi:DNA-binding transcriptional MerR regulator